MNLTFLRVLYIIKIIGRISCTWPERSSISKWRKVLFNICWLFAAGTSTFVGVTLVLGCFHYTDDVANMMKAISQFGAVVDILTNLGFTRKHSERLQDLISRMKNYLAAANEFEKGVVQSYLDRYKEFGTVMVLAYSSTASFFCLSPLFLPQDLPANGWIPFSTEPIAVYCMVYFAQVYCIWQAAFIFAVDIMIVTFIYFTAARLHILGTKLKQVRHQEILVNCIKEHQEIIQFSDDTKVFIESVLLKINITIGISVVPATFPLLYPQSKTVTGAFLSLLISIFTRMFFISWPADDLKEASELFAVSVNDIQWIGASRQLASTVLIMLQRSQKSFLIPMGALLPPLSLEYFSQCVTNVFSYVMGMKAMIES